MTNIKNIVRYNQLIRDNRHATKQLEESSTLPIAILNIEIIPLTKKDYSKLIKWSGEENTAYIAGCVNNFSNLWVASGKEIKDYYSLNEKNKKDKLILDLTDCFQPNKPVQLEPMRFFESLKAEPFFGELEGIAYLKSFGKIIMPYSEINKNGKGSLEISILGHWIGLRPELRKGYR
jgi:hypothetical protein